MPRKTSRIIGTTFPFDEDTAPFILVVTGDNVVDRHTDSRGFKHANTIDQKRELIGEAQALAGVDGGDCTLLAVWPGRTRSDVFEVDDLDQALDALIDGEGSVPGIDGDRAALGLDRGDDRG